MAKLELSRETESEIGPDTDVSAEVETAEVDAGPLPEEENLVPAERGQGGSPLNLTADDVPELADMSPGDTISFTIEGVADDGTFTLMAVGPSEAEVSMEDGIEQSLGDQFGIAEEEVGDEPMEEGINLEESF
tara:strand:+ start:811 stop:1209 length:399 start_codon:yes stop_codon:yes gene_type:complete